MQTVEQEYLTGDRPEDHAIIAAAADASLDAKPPVTLEEIVPYDPYDDYCPNGTHKDPAECDCCPTGKHSSVYDKNCFCYCADEMDFTPKKDDKPVNQQPTGSKIVNVGNVSGNTTSNTGSGSSSDSNYSYEPPHVHEPKTVLTGEGWSVSCGKGMHCEDFLGAFDLVINCTGHSVKEEHIIPIPELKKWSGGGQIFTELLLDWPDYGAISMPLQFWLDLMDYIRKNKLKVLVFCVGGHGRTGTAMSAMLMTQMDWDTKKTVEWLRGFYCHKAVESKKQIDYLYDLEDEINERKKAN